MDRAETEGREGLTVTVAFSPAPRVVEQVVLRLSAGATVQQAIEASGLLARHPAAAGLPAGIWGRKADAGAALRDGDRVEVLRPLQCDPKEARRIRYREKAERSGRAGGAGRRARDARDAGEQAEAPGPLSGTRST